ncbi:hypothetical protein M413DRAFT_445744 [Hebeloma cylindrosporum]|uniref:Uncharacterized protein n=1 Tax=Hebeloma cylindrosporum TaxID=76867 RepID=A0A0C3CBI1_HEBCY|nr:hypothetical protein M413DRAFT_445744 [Hebeloma cylindrosporum h7]
MEQSKAQAVNVEGVLRSRLFKTVLIVLTRAIVWQIPESKVADHFTQSDIREKKFRARCVRY